MHKKRQLPVIKYNKANITKFGIFKPCVDIINISLLIYNELIKKSTPLFTKLNSFILIPLDVRSPFIIISL